MGDFQFWLYIIIGVVYLLARMMKKQTPKTPVDLPESQPDKPVTRFEPPPARPRPPSKTLTFEELLREITESKTQQQKPAPPTEEYVDYEEELKDEAQDLEDVNYDYKNDRVAKEYATAEQQAFTRRSLEETMNIKNTDTSFEKFKVFEQQTQANLVDRYLIDFYDPEGLKKAIVMAEILQRKF
jgi:hypothetical protein